MQPSSTSKRLIRVIALLLLAFVALSFAPRSALAQSIIRGDQIVSGEVVDNDVVMFGDDVHLAGTVKGNAFISGRIITVDGHVEGSVFAIGERVIINGQVDQSVYMVAVSSQLGRTADIGLNAYFFGLSIVTERDSQVGRDLNGLSLGAHLMGSVGRDIRLVAGLLQLINLFTETTLGPTPDALQVGQLSSRAPGLGQFFLPGNIVFDVIGRASTPIQTAQPADTQAELVIAWFMARLREFLPLLITGLAGYWFLRPWLERSTTALQRRPLYTLGVGLVGLILSWAAIGAVILVFVLLLMGGVWLGRTTFWNVTWLFWSVAYPVAVLFFSLLLIFLNYGTKAIAMYAALTYLLDRFAPRAGGWRWLLLILGLVLYVFLRAIPMLGWVLSILVTAWGIGAAWQGWRGRRATALPTVAGQPTVVAEPPAGDSLLSP